MRKITQCSSTLHFGDTGMWWSYMSISFKLIKQWDFYWYFIEKAHIGWVIESIIRARKIHTVFYNSTLFFRVYAEQKNFRKSMTKGYNAFGGETKISKIL